MSILVDSNSGMSSAEYRRHKDNMKWDKQEAHREQIQREVLRHYD